MSALTKTEFSFPGQTGVYHGKVRDVYFIGDKLVMVATDRISAFDVVLPEGIPGKGQMLNQIAAKFLDATQDICPNWKLATPDPMVTVGLMCEGFPIEMIVRGYLCGSAWRAYKSGVREICGVKLPEGMRENERFPNRSSPPRRRLRSVSTMLTSRKRRSWRAVWPLRKNMPCWKNIRWLFSAAAPKSQPVAALSLSIRNTSSESTTDRFI